MRILFLSVIGSCLIDASYHRSNTSHTGALTFTSAVFFEIPLQAYIPTSDFPTVSSSFNLSTLAKTPLQEVQFKLLKEHLDSAGPWAQFGVIPFGGLASTPVNGTYYLSAISLNYHPISRGYVVGHSVDISSHGRYID